MDKKITMAEIRQVFDISLLKLLLVRLFARRMYAEYQVDTAEMFLRVEEKLEQTLSPMGDPMGNVACMTVQSHRGSVH
jgi:hypothetical protein